MHIKFSSSLDWNWDVEPFQLIHNSKTLTKAGADRSELQCEKTAGQTDALFIALGAYEGTGANRNGDLFKEAECLKNYKTFLKTGSKKSDGAYDGRALNRHHKNKPTDPKYGNIKAATYNRAMKRIELVVGLDNDKCAEEIQKLAEGKQVNVSMAAKVAFDKCSWCNHPAKTDAERCAHIPAKLGELNKLGEMCSMDNVNPQWFELSIVGRPADRIGMSLKLASDTRYFKTAADYMELYPGFVPPADDTVLVSKLAAEKRMLLSKLSELEKRVDGVLKSTPVTAEDKVIKNEKSKLSASDDLSASTMDELRKFEPGKLLKALAEKGIVFSPGDFIKYLFGDKLDSHKSLLSGLKSRLGSIFSDEDASDKLVNEERYEPTSGGLPKELKSLLGGLFDDHSLFESPVRGRIMRITITKAVPLHKESSAPSEDSVVKELATQYGAYKLAALRHMSDLGILTDDVLVNALMQNR